MYSSMHIVGCGTADKLYVVSNMSLLATLTQHRSLLKYSAARWYYKMQGVPKHAPWLKYVMVLADDESLPAKIIFLIVSYVFDRVMRGLCFDLERSAFRLCVCQSLSRLWPHAFTNFHEFWCQSTRCKGEVNYIKGLFISFPFESSHHFRVFLQLQSSAFANCHDIRVPQIRVSLLTEQEWVFVLTWALEISSMCLSVSQLHHTYLMMNMKCWTFCRTSFISKKFNW